MRAPKQQFGGDWTQEKLERVRKYLEAYATIMNRQKFRFAYIDAFAGTGYNTPRVKKETGDDFFSEFGEAETKALIDGSARIALAVEPKFEKYIFIEKDAHRAVELQKLKTEFSELATNIKIEIADANTYLQKLCKTNWHKHRAVLFLDPFGMQVTWETLQAIANTKAIDLWLLFPLGIGVNRLLRRDANIPQTWKERLNQFFGTAEWEQAFYQTELEPSLFGSVETKRKVANFQSIAKFFVKRLKTIFAGVADNPLTLHNSSNSPLYLLCFAAGNERGSKTAVKIAQDILKQ
jgi:three-Cys-motif partner protein